MSLNNDNNKLLNIDTLSLKLVEHEKLHVFQDISSEEMNPAEEELIKRLKSLPFFDNDVYSEIFFKIAVFNPLKILTLEKDIMNLYKEVTGKEKEFGYIDLEAFEQQMDVFNDIIDDLDIDEDFAETVLNDRENSFFEHYKENGPILVDYINLVSGTGNELKEENKQNVFNIKMQKHYLGKGNTSTNIMFALFLENDESTGEARFANIQVDYAEPFTAVYPFIFAYNNQDAMNLLSEIVDAIISQVNIAKIFKDSGSPLTKDDRDFIKEFDPSKMLIEPNE